MVRRGSSRPGVRFRACRPGFHLSGMIAALLSVALAASALPARAQSRAVKDIVLIDLMSKKKVWLKRAIRSDYKIHLSEKYFPNLKRHFGTLTLTTLSIQPVLGYAPREFATTATDPKLAGRRFFVVPLQPKPCALKLIRDPPIPDQKTMKPAAQLDADLAFYQYAAAACERTADRPLKVAIDMFRAKTLKDACEKGGQFTCGDALELYGRIRGDLKAGRLTLEDFKKGGVSVKLIRARVAQLLHRALEEGMRYYVRHRNSVDRRAVLDYLGHIIDHPLVASSTKAQAERGRRTVMADWCRADPKGCKAWRRGAVKRNDGENKAGQRRRGKPG